MIWKSCPGYPQYAVSEDGGIRIEQRVPHGPRIGSILKPQLSNSGYFYLLLGKRGLREGHFIHRLVARAFHGEPPSLGLWVAHNDGNRLNNHVSNLRWATPKENQADKRIHGTHLSGESVPTAKLKDNEVVEIREVWQMRQLSQDVIAARFGVSQSQISRIVRGVQRP